MHPTISQPSPYSLLQSLCINQALNLRISSWDSASAVFYVQHTKSNVLKLSIKSGIPPWKLGFTEAQNPLKFAACLHGFCHLIRHLLMARQVRYADINRSQFCTGVKKWGTAGTRRCDRGHLAHHGWPWEVGMQPPWSRACCGWSTHRSGCLSIGVGAGVGGLRHGLTRVQVGAERYIFLRYDTYCDTEVTIQFFYIK